MMSSLKILPDCIYVHGKCWPARLLKAAPRKLVKRKGKMETATNYRWLKYGFLFSILLSRHKIRTMFNQSGATYF